MKKIRLNEKGFSLVGPLIIVVVILLLFLGGYYLDRAKTPKHSSSATTSSSFSSSGSDGQSLRVDGDGGGSGSSGGEQLSTKGMTRPSQYLQICTTATNVDYITQGSPQCLGSDTYEGSYSPGVPGTLFSSPCETTTGSLRYIYISENETCPDNTKLVFYNTLCPSNAASSDDCTTPDSSDTTN
jgi:hypothetical protein